MKIIDFYLDELKEKLGSDYQIAMKMNVDRSVIANIRKRKAVSDENAVKMAELLGIDPGEVLLAAVMARSEGPVKAAWLSVSKRAGIAASLMLVASISTEIQESKAGTATANQLSIITIMRSYRET